MKRKNAIGWVLTRLGSLLNLLGEVKCVLRNFPINDCIFKPWKFSIFRESRASVNIN